MSEAQGMGKEKMTEGHPSWNLIYKNLENLIIVPGHAVFIGNNREHATCIDYWKGTFQAGYRGHDEARLYTEHIEAGVKFLAEDQKAMLLFSGGQTREEVGPYSEAQSYWYLAEACDWFGRIQSRERALTEEHARDSFENLLFSIYRFRQCTGMLPTNILVCGFEFKRNATRCTLKH